MPLPLPVLFAAATRIAQDERTHRAAKALFDAGSNALERRRAAKSTPVPDDIRAEPQSSWRAGLSRRMRFRKGQSGDLIRFEFTDEDGLKTERMVGNWASDGRELAGYCLNRKRECSFLIKGIGVFEEIEVAGK